LVSYAQRLLAACAPQVVPGATLPGRQAVTANGEGAVTGAASSSTSTEPLSEREMDVLRLLDEGLSNREIAERLFLSLGTVKTHIHNLYAKLDVPDRQHALMRAHRSGLL
jgi:ATP/maltotriose-dependent transcriptional regulator MalT